jgi:hypothetical protein
MHSMNVFKRAKWKVKQNCLVKIFVTLLVVLTAASFFEAFTAIVGGQTVAAQDDTLVPIPKKESNIPTLDLSQTATAQNKAMNFIEKVLSVNLSKYTIELKNSDIMDGIPLGNDNRKITTLMYELTPLEGNGEKDVITLCFTFEKDELTTYFTLPLTEVITTTQYANRNAAVKGFLEKYQTYTNIDSTNPIAMLDDVDLTKNLIITKETTKLVVRGTDLSWTYTVNGADYTKLEIGVIGGFVGSVHDTRRLYTIGDTSINITMEQAIDIALENLKYYSYDIFDGVVVSDFKVSRNNIVATLVTGPVDYELRPYWDLRMMLDEVYPGNVQGITAFIWANTGEVISYSNMAFGGAAVNLDDNNVSGSESPSSSPDNTLAILLAAVIATTVMIVLGLLIYFKKHQRTKSL